LALPLTVLLAAASSLAASENVAKGEEKEESKVPWRNSSVTYSNAFSAITLSKGAELMYNPYYAQSFSFKPSYYPTEDLSLKLRLDLEIELTTSDATDHAREWILSDLKLDMGYAPKLFKIPVVDVKAKVGLGLTFPTSIVSRGRSLLVAVAPGFSLQKKFPLLGGKVLPGFGLQYGFKATKYFHEYATAQVDPGRCSLFQSLNDPSCLHTGRRNQSWSFANSFGLQLEIMDKVSFSISVALINSLLYPLDEQEEEIPDGPTVTLPESEINHRAATMAGVELGYDLLDYLSLSLGASSFHGQLAPDSKIRFPFINRNTTIYLDLTVPVDKFVNQVQTWTGK
jgi:hypothetical protein